MPFSDPEARREAHRKSNRKHRAHINAHRKRRRLEARYAAQGGELAYLIAEQAADSARYRIKFGPHFRDETGFIFAL